MAALVMAPELRAWRARHRWTQRDAAAELRVSKRTYEAWEAGRPVRNPGPVKRVMEQVDRDARP